MKTFEGKVVLVTGANSGIGETTAVAFQEAGAKVFGIARRQETLDAARSRHPQIRWLLADLAKASEAKAAVENVVREAGQLDVLVNNAAVFAVAPLEDTSEAMMRDQFEINVFGLTFVTQAALTALKQSRGTIINLGSAAGHKPVPGGAHYGATKAAVESLSKSWALELAPHGVRVNVIAPGPTETPVFDKLPIPREMVQTVKDSFVKGVPLARIASTQEVARWILWLADPSVTWVTGAVFAIDGGMSLT
jgi:NAD(P)-dependent dehydrogenase (short-subunit alcohol dehydrogenase family)